MSTELNLCKILKGHEGETFYHAIVGKDVKIIRVSDGGYLFFDKEIPNLNIDGSFLKGGECMLFPSKDQRDWNKWIEEQNSKGPKTWSELCEAAQIEQIEIATDVIFDDNNKMIDMSCAVGSNAKLAKSALALLKIYQLIEVGYGGNITNKEWKTLNKRKYVIRFSGNENEFKVDNIVISIWSHSHVAFHTKEQAEEFLKYPENVQLLKDYFMLN